jgi:hypothetical protein
MSEAMLRDHSGSGRSLFHGCHLWRREIQTSSANWLLARRADGNAVKMLFNTVCFHISALVRLHKRFVCVRICVKILYILVLLVNIEPLGSNCTVGNTYEVSGIPGSFPHEKMTQPARIFSSLRYI